MLSTKVITNAEGASHYFMGHDNYYINQEQGQEYSEWWGKGADRLKLKGEVDAKVFSELLNGKLPDQTQVGLMTNGEIKHRAGFDLTFSAPKSVSMAALMGNDQRVIIAFNRAVDNTLTMIERECAQARMTKNGNTTYETTGNLIAAKFKHDISREGDPQLHIHTVIMNMTQRQDGNWRALASQAGNYSANTTKEINGFIERVRHNKLYYGAIMRSELAYELKQLGYDIVPTGKYNFFELAGISTQAIENFSQRRQQITEVLASKGMSSASAAATATLNTRKVKQHIDRKELAQIWQERDPKAIIEVQQTIKQSLTTKPKIIDNEARQFIDQAIAHLSEYAVYFGEKAIIKKATEYGGINTAALFGVINDYQKNGQLIVINERHNDHYFTTERLVAREQAILQAGVAKTRTPIVATEKLDKHLVNLSYQQQQTLTQVLTTHNQIVLIEGTTGTGKSHLIKPMVGIARSAGYKPVILTVSGLESATVNDQLKARKLADWWQEIINPRDCRTVHSYLNDDKTTSRSQLVVVDNAHKLSLTQIELLTQKAGAERLVLLWDPKALGSGTLFDHMVKHGAVNATLTNNQHLQSETIKSVIADTLSGDIAKAFDKIGERVISVADKDTRLAVMASHYANLKDCKIIMPSRAQCDDMNLAVRQALALNNSHYLKTLLPKNISSTEAKMPKSYRVTDELRFSDDNHMANRGEYLKVVGISDRAVRVKNSQGKIFDWQPDGKAEVYTPKQLAIGVGEVLINRRRSQLLLAGETVTVTAINKHQVTAKKSDGKTIVINEQRHLDYGYAVTAWQTTPATKNIISYQSALAKQSNQRQLYQTLCHAKEHVWLYTEDKQKLLTSINRYTGNNITAVQAALKNPNTPLQLIASAIAEQTAIKVDAARDAVQFAIERLSANEAAFTHKELLESAFKLALGTANSKQITQAAQLAEKSGQLIRGICSVNGTEWTTPEAIAQERAVLTAVKSEQGSLTPLVDQQTLQHYFSDLKIKDEHQAAITGICSSRDRITLVQGYAGTGKTTMLKYMEPLLGNDQLLCLAPTHAAVKELRDRGLTAQTLASFLLKPPDTMPKMIALDEASMVSTKACLALINIAQTNNAHCVIIGDREQYQAIEAGKDFTLLQDHGARTFYLKDITRQNDPLLAEAVSAAYSKDYAKSFAKLQHNIVEIADHTARAEQIAKDYLARSPQDRTKTMIITFGNAERNKQNAVIRRELLAARELTGQEYHAKIMVNDNQLRDVDKIRVSSYTKDLQVRFAQADYYLGIVKGEYLTVSHTDPEYRLVHLIKNNGDTVIWHLPQKVPPRVELYQQEQRILQAGTLIRWTRTDKDLNLISPEFAKVVAVTDQRVELQPLLVNKYGITAIDKPFSINPQDKRFQHWDYAWVMTGYGAQGKTIDELIVSASSSYKHLTSQKSWLVSITREVEHLAIYTDNKAKLLENISKTPGDKTSALETIGELVKSNVSLPTPQTAEVKTEVKVTENIISKTELRTEPKNYKNEILVTDINSKSTPKHDVKHINEVLVNNAEYVAEKLLGEPSKRSSKELRFGTNGSMVVALEGNRRGQWYDFEAGSGGNLLQLIAENTGLTTKADFPKLLTEAANIVGVSNLSTVKINKLNIPKKAIEKSSSTLAYAQKLVQESIGIKGTLAEKYLANRGIKLDHFPDTIRFHPAIKSSLNKATLPALLAVAKDNSGEVTAVQAIYLDDKTATKAKVNVIKQTFGKAGAGVPVSLGKAVNNQSVYLVEGPETGLSILMAMGNNTDVKVTLSKGNFKNVNPSLLSKKVVFCLDKDYQPETKETLKSYGERLIYAGKEVYFAQPKGTLHGIVKHDYNDILQLKSTKNVKEDLQKLTHYADKVTEAPLAKTLNKEQMLALKHDHNILAEKDKKRSMQIKDILKSPNYNNSISYHLNEKNINLSNYIKNINIEDLYATNVKIDSIKQVDITNIALEKYVQQDKSTTIEKLPKQLDREHEL